MWCARFSIRFDLLRNVDGDRFHSFIRLLEDFVNNFVTLIVNRRSNEDVLIKFFYSFLFEERRTKILESFRRQRFIILLTILLTQL
ncbi:hypothetical protein [Bacillus sp. ok061]|uniref:hypothetical protein n=1 Tax=Bacillus sp. ok061 TaxID=1761766 RepID=UPI00115B50F4|nr:hypothetical protein [Bacillus sp. ok061]